MDEKRSKELPDDALDAVSGGLDIEAIRSGPSATPLSPPGASGGTLSLSGPSTPSYEVPKSAVEEVRRSSGALGAMQTRLDATIAAISESGSSADPVEDVDMAAEMMNHTKNNILLQQAQIAQQAQQGHSWTLGLGL